MDLKGHVEFTLRVSAALRSSCAWYWVSQKPLEASTSLANKTGISLLHQNDQIGKVRQTNHRKFHVVLT